MLSIDGSDNMNELVIGDFVGSKELEVEMFTNF